MHDLNDRQRICAYHIVCSMPKHMAQRWRAARLNAIAGFFVRTSTIQDKHFSFHVWYIHIYLLCAVAEFLLAAWLHKWHKGGGGGVGCETFNKSKTIIITEIWLREKWKRNGNIVEIGGFTLYEPTALVDSLTTQLYSYLYRVAYYPHTALHTDRVCRSINIVVILWHLTPFRFITFLYNRTDAYK